MLLSQASRHKLALPFPLKIIFVDDISYYRSVEIYIENFTKYLRLF